MCGNSWKFLKSCENVCVCKSETVCIFSKFLKISENFWKILKFSEKFWFFLKISENFWKNSEIFWIFQKNLEMSEHFSENPQSKHVLTPVLVDSYSRLAPDVRLPLLSWSISFMPSVALAMVEDADLCRPVRSATIFKNFLRIFEGFLRTFKDF